MLSEKLKKLMEKKGESIDPLEKEAKLGAVRDMKGLAEDMLKDKMHGLKKVTVASPSAEGLEEGLDKAKELVEGKLGEEESEEASPMLDKLEGLDSEALEALAKRIQDLLAQKA